MSGGASQRRPEPSPDLFAAPAVLRFVPGDRWHSLSDCGRYAISRADLGAAFAAAHDYRLTFDAWRRGTDGAKVPINLGSFPVTDTEAAAFRTAEARCQAHADGLYVPAKGEVWKP